MNFYESFKMNFDPRGRWEGMDLLSPGRPGQRTAELTVNSNQQRSGRAFAPGFRKQWISSVLRPPSKSLPSDKRSVPSHLVFGKRQDLISRFPQRRSVCRCTAGKRQISLSSRCPLEMMLSKVRCTLERVLELPIP